MIRYQREIEKLRNRPLNCWRESEQMLERLRRRNKSIQDRSSKRYQSE